MDEIGNEIKVRFKRELASDVAPDTEPYARFTYGAFPKTLLSEIEQEVGKRLRADKCRTVGSARLGFSIAPDKLFRPFDENKSDLDLVVVSQKLFNQAIYEHRIGATGLFQTWHGSRVSMYRKYLSKGWLRLDTLPGQSTLGRSVFQILGSIKSDFECPKISVAIFPEERFSNSRDQERLKLLKSTLSLHEVTE